MSTSIIYAPPHLSESEYATFLDWSDTPEPWSVTADEYLAPCEETRSFPAAVVR